MDGGGFPEGARSLEEGGTPISLFQQATPRGGLGPPPVLWHHMCGEERPVEEAHRQGTLWPGTPILRKGIGFDSVVHFDRWLNDWDQFIPTKVVIDTPLLNKNRNGLNDSSASISTPISGPSKTADLQRTF